MTVKVIKWFNQVLIKWLALDNLIATLRTRDEASLGEPSVPNRAHQSGQQSDQSSGVFLLRALDQKNLITFGAVLGGWVKV